MRALDLHPEDLLDRDSRGDALRADERAQLAEHLALCDVCRLEQRSREDFREELSGAEPALFLDDLVTRALSGAHTVVPRRRSNPDVAPDAPTSSPTEEEPTEAEIAAALGRGRKARPARFLILAAAAAAMLTTLGGVAAASRLGNVFQSLFPGQATPSTVQETPPLPSTPAAPRKASRPALPVAPAGVVEETAPTSPTPPPRIDAPPPITPLTRSEPPRPAVHAPQPPRSSPARAEAPSVASPTLRSTPARTEAPSVASPAIDPPPPAIVPDVGGPQALFADANRARARGERTEAVRGYRELQARYPGSAEARLSHATLGRLLLDTGDASAALRELDAYLGGGQGALREDALAARATALSRLGRHAEEATAWSRLIEAYPGSIHAPRARARLAELGSR